MAGTIRLTTELTTADPASPSASQQTVQVRDSIASTHDYVDATPRNVATAGLPGVAFVQLETPVVQLERFIADVPAGSELVIRFGGAPAVVIGAKSALAIEGDETLELAIDGGEAVTTTLASTDTTVALVAKRINWAHGAQVASVDPATGALRLTGVKSGGADARARAWQAGSVAVLSGTALEALGLTTGTSFGAGEDVRVGAGAFVRSFSAASLPKRVELSGSAINPKFWIAGKAS